VTSTSKAAMPKAMILCGDGLNCERETASAFDAAGFVSCITHINELVRNPKILGSFQAMGIPGGFSFGDELGSGQILAKKLRTFSSDELREFVRRGNPVIGICNGFQALVKLGLLPWPDTPQEIALAHNSAGNFINRWVEVEFPDSVCIWTKGIEDDARIPIQYPVRHGEGRVTAADESKVLQELKRRRQIPLRYRQDFNGSMDRIAGLCDPSGVVFGLMPHPEAAVSDWLHPSKEKGSARGLDIFKNARRYVDER